MTVTFADSTCAAITDRPARLSRRRKAARALTAASHERPRPTQRDPWLVTQRRPQEKLSAPAQRPRAATCRRYQPQVVARKPRRSGRFRRLGRATGSVRASASIPLRPRDRSGVCLRHGLRSARLRGLPQAAGSASRLRSRAACRDSTFWARPAPASRPRSGSSALRSGASALAFSGSLAPSRVVPGQPAGAYPQAAAYRSPPVTDSSEPCAVTCEDIPIATDAPATQPGAAEPVTDRRHSGRRPAPVKCHHKAAGDGFPADAVG